MKKTVLLSILAGFLLVSCRAIAPGAETHKDKTSRIQTFVDENRNGKFDSHENPLPDVLVAARSNIHGTMTYAAQLTDQDGQTQFTTSYTHYFDLLAFVPCGYEATTPLSVEAGRKESFGFAPVDPQIGVADNFILFWKDDNQDGEYQTGELPLAGEMLFLDPGLDWRYSPDIALGQLVAQTNSGGEAAANLGSSCGEVVISIPEGWLPSNDLGDGIWEEGRYHLLYQPGRTNVFLGVIPND